ncbi:MAG: hypothetical protein FJY77_01560 [Candidatus Altiarchaeales archaeon]|nr:hypothetical protein [Candidatus Altiarchaeales archaeon]
MSQNFKYVIKGVKKLFSLARTKIRLARQANTLYTKPKPLPLVKKLAGVEVDTIDEAEKHLEKLKKDIDYSNPKTMAETTIQLLDIIEGVKHKYEPKEYFCLLKEEEIEKLLENKVNILLACQPAEKGINLYIGENPPKNTIHLGRVTTNLASFLATTNLKLENIKIHNNQKTLINNAVHQALGEYGANLL